MSFYDYSITRADGEEISLEAFRGKVVIMVNTATGCGFTPQYKELEALHERYSEQGLEIIDIPCNQFGNQAPGDAEEIAEFCSLTYHTQFPQMQKSEVKGEGALPVYAFLTSEQGFEGLGRGPKALAMRTFLRSMDKDYAESDDVKWNFTKFVIDREGSVVARFEPTHSMDKLEELVASLL